MSAYQSYQAEIISLLLELQNHQSPPVELHGFYGQIFTRLVKNDLLLDWEPVIQPAPGTSEYFVSRFFAECSTCPRVRETPSEFERILSMVKENRFRQAALCLAAFDLSCSDQTSDRANEYTCRAIQMLREFDCCDCPALLIQACFNLGRKQDVIEIAERYQSVNPRVVAVLASLKEQGGLSLNYNDKTLKALQEDGSFVKNVARQLTKHQHVRIPKNLPLNEQALICSEFDETYLQTLITLGRPDLAKRCIEAKLAEIESGTDPFREAFPFFYEGMDPQDTVLRELQNLSCLTALELYGPDFPLQVFLDTDSKASLSGICHFSLPLLRYLKSKRHPAYETVLSKLCASFVLITDCTHWHDAVVYESLQELYHTMVEGVPEDITIYMLEAAKKSPNALAIILGSALAREDYRPSHAIPEEWIQLMETLCDGMHGQLGRAGRILHLLPALQRLRPERADELGSEIFRLMAEQSEQGNSSPAISGLFKSFGRLRPIGASRWLLRRIIDSSPNLQSLVPLSVPLHAAHGLIENLKPPLAQYCFWRGEY